MRNDGINAAGVAPDGDDIPAEIANGDQPDGRASKPNLKVLDGSGRAPFGSPLEAVSLTGRRKGRFTQTDVVKVFKAAQKAEVAIDCVRIEPDGTILIVPGNPDRVAKSTKANDWD